MDFSLSLSLSLPVWSDTVPNLVKAPTEEVKKQDERRRRRREKGRREILSLFLFFTTSTLSICLSVYTTSPSRRVFHLLPARASWKTIGRFHSPHGICWSMHNNKAIVYTTIYCRFRILPARRTYIYYTIRSQIEATYILPQFSGFRRQTSSSSSSRTLSIQLREKKGEGKDNTYYETPPFVGFFYIPSQLPAVASSHQTNTKRQTTS